jgi:hypothetical protein
MSKGLPRYVHVEAYFTNKKFPKERNPKKAAHIELYPKPKDKEGVDSSHM